MTARRDHWRPNRALIGVLACAVLGVTAGCSANRSAGPAASSGTNLSSPAPTTRPTSAPTTSSTPAPTTSSRAAPSTSTSPAALPAGWVDQDISFQSDGLTIHGTFRHPSDSRTALPAVLLIAGSGPTDRNGNSRLVPGSMNTLSNLAGVLTGDGVVSLRYDKLGSGATGLGEFAAHLDTIGVDVFTREAQAALRFLSGQSGVDRARLSVYGHSEGALFALLLATDTGRSAVPVHSLALLEPLSRRYLDIITTQVTAQAHQQLQSEAITPNQYDQALNLLHQAVTQLRTKGTVPADMDYGLSTLFTPSSLKFLRQADAMDPAKLAEELPATMPVLITCSDADIQVSCADAKHLAIDAASLDFVRLTGVDHVLKQDTSADAANYGKDLPFSAQLTAALRSFTTK